MNLRARTINGRTYVGDARIYHRNLNHARARAHALRRLGLNVRTVKYRPKNPIFVNLLSYNKKKGRFEGIDDLEGMGRIETPKRSFPQKDPFFVRKIPAKMLNDLWRGPLGSANFTWGPPLKREGSFRDGFSAMLDGIETRIILYPGQLQGEAKEANSQSLKDYISSIGELYGRDYTPVEDTMHRFLDRGPYIDAGGDLYPIIAYSDDGDLPSEWYHDQYYDPQTYLIRQTEVQGNGDDNVVISTARGNLRYDTRGNHGNLHFFCGDQEPVLNQQQIQTLASSFGAPDASSWPYNERVIEDVLREIALKAKKHLLRCPHCAAANPGYVEAYSFATGEARVSQDEYLGGAEYALEPDPYQGNWFPYDNLQFPNAWGQNQNPRYDEWLRLIRSMEGIDDYSLVQALSYLDGLLVDAKTSAQTAELETRDIDDTVMEYLRDNDLKDLVPYRSITTKADPFRRIDDL
jgi:hypothetical protein